CCHRNVHYHRPKGVQAKQDIRLEIITLADLVEGKQTRHLTMNRGVSVCWIEERPVARRKLCQERQYGIAEEANCWHRLEILEIKEAIALGIVRLSLNNRFDKIRDQGRIHLAITINLDDDVVAVLDGLLIAREDRSSNASVLLVKKYLHSRVGTGLQDACAGVLWTAVVDDIDA